MKNSRAVQILTIALALSMLTTYVVYSQRERNRSVAPGSKSMALTGTKETSAPAISLNTNHLLSPTSGMVASGSKSTVPVFDVRPITAPQVADHPIQNPAVFAPGSKSGRIFDLGQTQQNHTLKLVPAVQPAPRTNTINPGKLTP